MDRIRVVGGRALEGTVRISGAKNASLPALCAALLTDESVVLRNVPEVRDIRTWAACSARWAGPWRGNGRGAREGPDVGGSALRPGEDDARVRARPRTSARPGGPGPGLPPRGLRHRRASHQPPPRRPREDGGRDLRGARLRRGAGRAAPRGRDLLRHADRHGHGERDDAAARAEGETVLRNAATEPEIEDLAELLVAMGAGRR